MVSSLQGVTIHRAKDLANKDVFDKSDPYCVVRIGQRGESWASKFISSQGTQWRSYSVQNQLNPEWNLSFSCDKDAEWLQAGRFIGREVHVRVYDDDTLGDDFLGEIIVPIPDSGECERTWETLAGTKDVQGAVEYSFFTDISSVLGEKGDTVLNGTGTADTSPVSYALNIFSSWLDVFSEDSEERFLDIVGMALSCMSDNEKSKQSDGPCIEYYRFLFMEYLQSEPSSLFLQYSGDGGKTATGVFGGNCTMILEHEAVKTEMSSFCQRWINGEIFRDNNFGVFLFNHTVFGDVASKSLTLNVPPKPHERLIRPLISSRVGIRTRWSPERIYQNACSFFDDLIQSGKPFLSQADSARWSTKFLWKVVLNRDITDGQAVLFSGYMRKILRISILPEWLVEHNFFDKALEVEETINFRRDFIAGIKTELISDLPEDFPASDLNLQAAALFDMLFFAAGTGVPSTITRVLAMMDMPDSPAKEVELSVDNLLGYIMEVIRLHPLVNGCAYYTDESCTERVVLSTACANRDHTAWGEDANKFRIRSMEDYSNKMFNFIEPVIDPSNSSNDRSCPGKDLALNMVHGFIKAFLERRSKFTLSEEEAGKITRSKFNRPIFNVQWKYKSPNVEEAPLTLDSILEGDANGAKRLSNIAPAQLTKLFSELKSGTKLDQVDDFTKFFYKFGCKKREIFEKGKGDQGKKTIGQICLPKPPRKLAYFMLPGVDGIGIPKDDEDWEDKTFFQKVYLISNATLVLTWMKILNKSDSTIYFDSIEEGLLMKELVFQNEVPESYDFISNWGTDEEISTHAFAGLGQTYLRRVEGAEDEKYEVDLTHLAPLEVRDGFERYGARAVFKKDRSIDFIHVSSLGKDVHPNDNDWEFAKWTWKVSLCFSITAVNHLVHTHWMISNCAHIACRTELGEDHPVRRVMKVFLFNTGAINSSSTLLLYPEDQLLHRMSGLTHAGMVKGFDSAVACFKYETFPDYLNSKQLGEDLQTSLPIYTDALPVWDTLLKFFTNYVALFYTDDAAVQSDLQLVQFWDCVENRGRFGCTHTYGLPALTRNNLVNYLTHVAFTVSCWHEFVGGMIQYCDSPNALGFSIRSDKTQMDVQQFVNVLVLIGLTGRANPRLMENWKHLLPSHPEAAKLHQTLIEDLEKLSAAVDKRNEGAEATPRMRAFNAFNPKYFETSVSI